MEYDDDEKRYKGSLVVCLRSTNRAELVQKLLPLPLRRIIGDLSDREKVLAGLDLVPQPPGTGGDR